MNTSDLAEDKTGPTLTQVIEGRAKILDAVKEIRPHLFLLPSDPQLDEAANYIIKKGAAGYQIFKNLLKHVQGYDFIFFDLPANFTPLTEAALIACTEMFIPCMLEPYSIDGLILMMEKIGNKLEEIGHSLELTGIVPIKVDFSEKMTDLYLKELQGECPNDMLPYVRTDANVKKAQSVGKSVVEAYPGSHAAKDFIELAKLLQKEG